MITKGGKVADIGCDHAYLSIYMIKHQIAESVIAMDVNRGPLERARDNIRKSGYENQINVRLSDGIKELNVGEADTLLIAGMGGGLIQKILLYRIVLRVKKIYIYQILKTAAPTFTMVWIM